MIREIDSTVVLWRGVRKMQKSDLILRNGKVYSVNMGDEVTRAESVAVKDGKIIFVGADDEAMALADENTEIVDCHGNTILPGLCDAHCHPSIAATSVRTADLFGFYPEEGETSDELIDRIMMKLKEYIDNNPDQEIIRGAGWIYQAFNPNDRFPTRHDIDKICPDKPVILNSFCQHNLWVNTKAIEAAGLDENVPEPATGHIYREENGYPQGVFSDPEAMEYIKSGVPGYDLSVEEYKEGIRWYQKEGANKYGVTFVQDCMHSDNARQAYKELAEAGELTLRMRGVYHLKPENYKEQLPEFIERKGTDNVADDFRVDTIKMFAEGEFVMIDGYLPEYCEAVGKPADYNGSLYWPDDVFVENAVKAMEAGFNVHVHAMGDGAVKQSAECLAKAQQITGRQPRNIIAHLMITPDETAELMGREHIIANCQPAWMMLEADVTGCIEAMGKEKALQSYPLRKFFDNDVMVAFGTDFPVTPPPDTMQEICVAMTRTITPGTVGYDEFKGQILGDERPATLSEAVKALSIGGAYQMFGEEYTGTIEVGKSAELVVLDCDIEVMAPTEIYKAKVEKTYFKGKKVYDLNEA